MESISQRFRRDHHALLKTFEDLRNAVEGADARTIQSVWTEFEQALNRHLDAEEEFILPALQAAHPGEVTSIRREHDRIRDLVFDLGIRADLRTLRRDVADALVHLLEEHAAREEIGVYALADRELKAQREGLFARLADRIDRVA
ncbi:MAG: hemerythrin domain-containing protein [Polyangiaceae bacterium]